MTLQIALLTPYHGGSHRAWAEGYKRYTQHRVELFTMPARFWKWRMHGGAVTLAQNFRESGFVPDLLLATDMLDLTTFLALTRHETGGIPTALYMHENQLTYPLPADGRTGPMRRQKGERDQHYAFVNYASMLAASLVVFNSHFHLETFFEALPTFLRHFPDYQELETVSALRAKSTVVPVGVDFSRLQRDTLAATSGKPPLIVWNQRWEYDKNPSAFFDALYAMAAEGQRFRVALCGERFRRRPEEFEEAEARLGRRLIHAGFAGDETYRRLLWEAEITISTAIHEFFGISILEAVYCSTFPILPYGLSYPELIPEAFHQDCLYRDDAGLHERLRWALTHREEAAEIARSLQATVMTYSWQTVAPLYDAAFSRLAT